MLEESVVEATGRNRGGDVRMACKCGHIRAQHDQSNPTGKAGRCLYCDCGQYEKEMKVVVR